MFDITLERPTGTGDTELDEFEGVRKLSNVPMTDHAVVTTADGDREKVPCATVVAVEPTDESSNTEA